MVPPSFGDVKAGGHLGRSDVQMPSTPERALTPFSLREGDRVVAVPVLSQASGLSGRSTALGLAVA